MKTFSELARKQVVEDLDIVPIVDASEDDPALQNKVAEFADIKDYFLGYIQPYVDEASASAAAAAESAATAEQFEIHVSVANEDLSITTGGGA